MCDPAGPISTFCLYGQSRKCKGRAGKRKAQARAEAALNEELELNGTDISDTVE